MKAKKAYIYWTHPVRKYQALPIGTKYFPHIIREDDPKQEHWSVYFIITEENCKSEGVIELTMLVDNRETRAFLKTLMSNTKFILTEAYTEVARGYIL